ncbi:MAG: PIN domain-containing protein [Lamprobacter sp.]|uniref:PIN domain-containing protein n=1 Tax=Lamprobacter sp. TaxID=3100796 RepID=UPI002B259A2C|nr:PIN domain-containing protein [Lamprobacter sp.]MEA3639457.1 PIN domain-containing protein [Lamprobacter sp.]
MFLDANILFSAAYRDGNPALLLFDLASADRCTLVTSAFAWDEVHRNIALKCPQRAPILNALKEQLEDTPTPGASAIAEAAKHGLPDKDAPILAAAMVAEVDILVTGDRTHFGHLYGKGIAGLRVLSLREALASVLEDQ